MKEIIEWESCDGLRFDDQHDCAVHEARVIHIEVALGKLERRLYLEDLDLEWQTGKKSIQQEPEKVQACRDLLLRGDFDHESEIISRFWDRMGCIDQDNREWQSRLYWTDNGEAQTA